MGKFTVVKGGYGKENAQESEGVAQGQVDASKGSPSGEGAHVISIKDRARERARLAVERIGLDERMIRTRHDGVTEITTPRAIVGQLFQEFGKMFE